MAYDLVRGVTVVSQGLGTGVTRLGDTWEFDGIYWHRYRGATVPAGGRANSAMTFDLALRRMVLFGGVSGTPLPTDTWEFRPDRPSFTQYGAGCAGSATDPALDSSTLPALGGTLQMAVAPVPSNTATFLVLGRTSTPGLPIPPTSCELRVLSLLLVLSAPAVGTVASYPIAVPNAPELAGATVWFQGGAWTCWPIRWASRSRTGRAPSSTEVGRGRRGRRARADDHVGMAVSPTSPTAEPNESLALLR